MTPRDYTKTFQEDVLERLMRIETRLEPLPELDKRLDSLEKQRNYFAGFVGAVMMAVGIVLRAKGLIAE